MSSVLFIVEGGNAEVKFLENVLKKSIGELDYEYYSFGTSIYPLYLKLAESDFNKDILLTLKETESNISKKEKLVQLLKIDFTDIYLIFDFDPHNSNFSYDKIIQMESYFNDSTDNGKLYINYPMLESYKHIKSKNDFEFFNRNILIDDLKNEKGKWYKKLVNEESGFLNPALYSNDDFNFLIQMHFKKAYFMLYGTILDTVTKEIYKTINNSQILITQINNLNSQGIIQVINTSLFIVIDYNPTMFFNNNHHI